MVLKNVSIFLHMALSNKSNFSEHGPIEYE